MAWPWAPQKRSSWEWAADSAPAPHATAALAAHTTAPLAAWAGPAAARSVAASSALSARKQWKGGAAVEAERFDLEMWHMQSPCINLKISFYLVSHVLVFWL